RLQLNNGILTDEAVIYFSANANNGFDIYDAPKMKNSDISIPGIYTMLNNEQIVINAMNSIPLNQEISLGFVPGSASSFSIKANEVSNLPAGVKLILKDNVSNVETELTDAVSTYNFSSATATDSRFSVIFRSAATVTATVDTDTKNMSIYRNANNHIEVNCSNDISDNAFISVYNALGQKLESKQISSTTTVIEKTFNSGVYLVTVTNGVKSITKKVILN
ncbi:MAG: T9SS type A sorting domain-containing protein, partial [Paludibacter sp.]